MVTREAFDHFKFYPILFSSNINPSIEVVRFLISVTVLLLGFPPHPIVKKTHRSPSLVWFPKSMLGNLHGTNTNTQTQIHKYKSLCCAFLTLPRVVSAEQQGENLFLNLFPEWDRVHWSGLPELSVLSSAISLAILANVYQVMKNPFKYISWWKSHLCVGSHRRALLTIHILLQRLLRPSFSVSNIFLSHTWAMMVATLSLSTPWLTRLFFRWWGVSRLGGDRGYCFRRDFLVEKAIF